MGGGWVTEADKLTDRAGKLVDDRARPGSGN
jgi:hypothetical protein